MTAPPPSAAEHATLVEQHRAVLGWLARLEQSRAHVPARVVERVRDDYRARLLDLEAELAPHLEAIRAERESLRPDAEDAERRYAAAADELDEARLRYLAGELGEDEWLREAPPLEVAVHTAREESERIAARLAALGALIARLDGSDGPGGEAPEAAVWEEGEASGDAPWVELIDEGTAAAPDRFDELDFLNWVSGGRAAPDAAGNAESTPAADGADPDDEAAFLAELDRALGR